MAPVPATIDVSFISNFTGQHRICWRIAPNLVYDCSTVVVCAGLGNPCSASIPITVDNESCATVLFEGYVQAACEDIGSLNGRIPFSQTFVPNPTCKSYRVSCDNVPVLGTLITNAGSGYDPLNPPLVVPFGGGGAGAAVLITIGNAMVTINPGSVPYADGVYPGVPVITVSGIGFGAIATVTVAGGIVTGYTFTSSGQDYFAGDTFTFNDADIGAGGGSGFQAGFQAGYGTVTLITLTNPGNGYTTPPGLVFPAPLSGITATADAILDVCPDQQLGQSCDLSPGDLLTGLALNQFAMMCMVSLPNPPALSNYLFSPFGCCYNCNQVSFLVSGLSPAGTLVYTDCTTHELVYVPFLPGDSIGPICMVANSWFYTPGSIITTGVGAICP